MCVCVCVCLSLSLSLSGLTKNPNIDIGLGTLLSLRALLLLQERYNSAVGATPWVRWRIVMIKLTVIIMNVCVRIFHTLIM